MADTSFSPSRSVRQPTGPHPTAITNLPCSGPRACSGLVQPIRRQGNENMTVARREQAGCGRLLQVIEGVCMVGPLETESLALLACMQSARRRHAPYLVAF